MRLAAGEIRGIVPASSSTTSTRCPSRAGTCSRLAAGARHPVVVAAGGRRLPVLASRGCPEFCTYCPHRILAGYRARSVGNIVDELERLCGRIRSPS